MRIVTSKIMKEIEDKANLKEISYSFMMEKAGKATADSIIKLQSSNKNILFLCGKGNNAGDAFVAARILSELDYNVHIYLLLGNNFSELSREKFNLLNLNKICLIDKEFILLDDFDAIVDAVFGTGFNGEIPTNVQNIFRHYNNTNFTKISLDIPSGISCDNGFIAQNHFIADYTLAFGAYKPAHILKCSIEFCGKISLIDIGISQDTFSEFENIQILDSRLASSYLPVRKSDSNKGDFGKLLIIGGSFNMPGSITLATMAALRSGVGLIQTGAPRSIIPNIANHVLESTFIPLIENQEGFISKSNIEKIEKIQDDNNAILIGMGMGVCEDTIFFINELIKKTRIPMIIDGDGINCIAKNIDILKEKKAPIILTPHMKEMSRLTNNSIEDIKADRFNISKKFAEKYDVTLILKDSNTLITSADKQQVVNQNGNSGMAKGGSGDVLAGIVSSLVAQGIDLYKAAQLGVFLHASSGDFAAQKFTQNAMLPHDIIFSLSNAFEVLLELKS